MSGCTREWWTLLGPHEHCEKPVLIAPQNRSVCDYPNPQFRWQAVAGTDRYQIQIARSPEFLNPFIDRYVTSVQWQDSVRLFQGTWYWRLRAMNADGGSGHWSMVWSFDFRVLSNLDVYLNMIYVQGDSFMMGNDQDWMADNPEHPVIVDDFYLSETEVTLSDYVIYLNAVFADSQFCIEKDRITCDGDDYVLLERLQVDSSNARLVFQVEPGYEKHPVNYVTWKGAQAFCSFVGGRLPTEAEWEFAALGGTKRRGYRYSGSRDLDDVGWCESPLGPYAVAQKLSNRLGFYDMSGNVFEWCADWYGYNYYEHSPLRNPKGSDTGTRRVIRGGCWRYDESYCRVTTRSQMSGDEFFNLQGYIIGVMGFRVAKDAHRVSGFY
jgi:formylglycine-generating enzyme required for sulfatase activity